MEKKGFLTFFVELFFLPYSVFLCFRVKLNQHIKTWMTGWDNGFCRRWKGIETRPLFKVHGNLEPPVNAKEVSYSFFSVSAAVSAIDRAIQSITERFFSFYFFPNISVSKRWRTSCALLLRKKRKYKRRFY